MKLVFVICALMIGTNAFAAHKKHAKHAAKPAAKHAKHKKHAKKESTEPTPAAMDPMPGNDPMTSPTGGDTSNPAQ